jgi:uncharacterized membrane protein
MGIQRARNSAYAGLLRNGQRYVFTWARESSWAAAAGERMSETRVSNGFPTLAGVLFGLGLGGFFDGIVLHQLLQWHHTLSNWYPIVDVPSLELNTVWDGIFHSSTYVFVVIGLLILWRTAHRRHLLWSNKLFVGTLLLGWGLFNTVEGIVDHEILAVQLHPYSPLARQGSRRQG